MDDRDYYERMIATRPGRREASTFFKEAFSLSDAATKTTKFIRKNAPEIAGALLGASAFGLYQYNALKPGKDGTSFEQRALKDARDAHDRSTAKKRAEGKEMGFTHDLAGATLEGLKPLVDVGTKHPGKAALSMTTPGALTGIGLSRLFFR